MFSSLVILVKLYRIFGMNGIIESPNISAAIPNILICSFICWTLICSLKAENLLRQINMRSLSVTSCCISFLTSSIPCWRVWLLLNFETILTKSSVNYLFSTYYPNCFVRSSSWFSYSDILYWLIGEELTLLLYLAEAMSYLDEATLSLS